MSKIFEILQGCTLKQAQQIKQDNLKLPSCLYTGKLREIDNYIRYGRRVAQSSPYKSDIICPPFPHMEIDEAIDRYIEYVEMLNDPKVNNK